jgi:hypothetical protein
MTLSPSYRLDRLTGRKARKLAQQMPAVMARGGIYDNDALYPALAAADLDLPDTRVLADGQNILVLVHERWLIKPQGERQWAARLWRGPRESRDLLLPADDDEALDSRVSRGAAWLHRRVPLVAPLALLAVAYVVKLGFKAAGHEVLSFLPLPF